MKHLVNTPDAELAAMVRTFALLHANGEIPSDAHLILFADGSGGIQSLKRSGPRCHTLHHHDYWNGASWLESSADVEAPHPRRGPHPFVVEVDVEGQIQLDRVREVRRRMQMYTQCCHRLAPDRHRLNIVVYAASEEDARAQALAEVRSWELTVVQAGCATRLGRRTRESESTNQPCGSE